MLDRIRRDRQDRSRRFPLLVTQGVERLESRLALSGNILVQGGFLAVGNLHAFKITGIDQDPTNSGFVNPSTGLVHIISEVDRNGLPLGGNHTAPLNLTITDVSNIGTSSIAKIGTYDQNSKQLGFDINFQLNPGPNSLTFTVSTVINNKNYSFDVKKANPGAFDPATNTGTLSAQNLTETLFLDTTKPTAFLPTNVTITNTSIPFSGTDSGTNQSGVSTVTLTDSQRPNFQVVLQGNGATTTAGLYDFGGVQGAQGSHTIKAVVVDQAGNVSNVAQQTYIFDTVPPTTPSMPKQTTASTQKAPKFQFTGSTDENGIARYVAIYDGDTTHPQDLALSTTFDLSPTVQPGSHTVQVEAFDNAGNSSLSPPSDPFVFTSQTIMNLQLAHSTGGPSSPFTSDATLSFSGLSERSSLLNYQASINYGPFTNLGSSATITPAGLVTFPPAGIVQGKNHVDVRAVLTDNSILGPIGVDFVYDTVSPIAPTGLGLVQDTGSSATDNITQAGQLKFTASTDPSPGSGIQFYQATVNGSVQRLETNTTFTPNSLIQGTNTISVIAIDKSNNPPSPAATFEFALDTVAPVVSTPQLFGGDQNPSANGLAIPVTNNPTPRITLNLTDQTFARVDNRVNVVVKDIVTGQTFNDVVSFGKGTDATKTQAETFTLPALGFGNHQIIVTASDAAGNSTQSQPLTFVIVNTGGGNATTSAPGTPIFNTSFSLALASMAGYDPNKPDFPWTMSFDRTTQTLWVDLRGGDTVSKQVGGGDQVIQLDPATGLTHIYDLRGLDQGIRPNGEPHGMFFDFETHLTPRIWFTRREDGFLSYLDPTNNTLVTYNFRSILSSANFTHADLHAVDIDPAGRAWVSDQEDGVILELDLHKFDGMDNPTLSAVNGTLIIHKLPTQLITAKGALPVSKPGGDSLVGPHGIDVVTDDQTGKSYVWFSNMGANGTFSLLRAGAGPGGSDLWSTWDLTQALNEGGAAGAPLFATIDNLETPGRPADDRIWFADPGVGNKDLVRQLIPGPLPPTAGPSTARLQTREIPPIPGSNTPSQPNQVYIDREGNVFYIDRQSGIGRIDANSSPFDNKGVLNVPGSDKTVPGMTYESNETQAIPIVPTVIPFTAMTTTTLPRAITTVGDLSQTVGLNQYAVLGTNNNSRGFGPFRGTITAGSVVFGSQSQNDVISDSVFAETVRRQLAVTLGPGTARQAFQVLRSGDLVMTYRNDGEIIDHQVDLTQLINGPAIVGDPSAVTDGSGIVHVFGRNAQGGLLEYRLDPRVGVTTTVTARTIPSPPAGSGLLAANPTAFTFGTGASASALATTSLGHLILFAADFGAPVDLTAAVGGAASSLVYSSPGVTESNGTVYIYATNQRGGLLEYKFPAGGGAITFRPVNLKPSHDTEVTRDTEVFQDVEAITTPDGVRHIFATDGTSRLVHITAGGPGGDTADNITFLNKDTAAGYSAYQQPYAGRVYSDLGVTIDPVTGDLLVYGNNGRDLVEFRGRTGSWKITDLTNNLANGQPANRVFGAPTAYFLPNGERDVLLISEDAEVIDYYQIPGLSPSTVNITLALGNSGSPPSFTNPAPATPPAVPVGPLPLAPDATRLNASAAGFLQAPGNDATYRFVAAFTGRVSIIVSAPAPGLNPVLSLASNGNHPRVKGRRQGGHLVASFTINVVAGRSYDLGVSGVGKSTGGFSIRAHYLSVSHPKGRNSKKGG